MSIDRKDSLLILACSQRKFKTPGLIPALERYDGGSYRIIRKAKREGYWSSEIAVLIVSAKYGLIEGSTLIDDYEQKMTVARAQELEENISKELRVHFETTTYKGIYIDLGKNYMLAVEHILRNLKPVNLQYASGKIGVRQAKLKQWIINISNAQL